MTDLRTHPLALTAAEREKLTAYRLIIPPAPGPVPLTAEQKQSAVKQASSDSLKYKRIAEAYLAIPTPPFGQCKALAEREGLSYPRLLTAIWRLRRDREATRTTAA